MTKKPWRNKPRPEKREGRHIPMTLWECLGCGKRLRGDARIWPHLERSGHGVAFGRSGPKWKTVHR